MLLVCCWYAAGMLPVCCWYATGMLLVCYWYVASMLLVRCWYAAGMLLVCDIYTSGMAVPFHTRFTHTSKRSFAVGALCWDNWVYVVYRGHWFYGVYRDCRVCDHNKDQEQD